MFANRTPTVVVFIPPAVDPGDPPISIRIIMINCPLWLITVKSAVLNPAVLGVTAWKKDSNIRSCIGASENSKKKKYRVGKLINKPNYTALMKSTN